MTSTRARSSAGSPHLSVPAAQPVIVVRHDVVVLGRVRDRAPLRSVVGGVPQRASRAAPVGIAAAADLSAAESALAVHKLTLPIR